MQRVRVVVRDYKRGQPWVVEAEHEEVVEVADGERFWVAADRRWPRERHGVEPLTGERLT